MIKYLTFFLWHSIFEIQYVFYTYSTSQFRVGTFQVLNRHMRLVATVLYSSVLECLFSFLIDGLLGYPIYGVPTIRSDLPAPRIRRVSDRTNYGEEGNAYSLLHPSIFAQKGVFERDFFKTRSKKEVQHIISKGLKEMSTL